MIMQNKSAKSIALIVIAFLATIYFVTQGGKYIIKNNIDSTFQLSIFSIVEIEPITQLRNGFIQEFKASNFYRNHAVQISNFNAQGDSGLINQIADKIATKKPNLVYVLGTPAAQAVQKRDPKILLVQGAATDPVSAGLANSWGGSGRNYVATSDRLPVSKQLSLLQMLMPKAKRIGIIYNPGEVNSVSVITMMRNYIEQQTPSLKLVERPVSNSSDVARSIQSLIGNVDVIYIPPDNTVHSALPIIGRLTNEYGIPYIATVRDAINEGALATLSLDFFELGRESASLALMVLNGNDPGSIPIKTNDNQRIDINKELAKRYGVDLDQLSLSGKIFAIN
jgi:putative ABC transport system substrate-binding protein